MSDRFEAVFEELDLLLIEARRLRATGPLFNIYHRFHQPGSICSRGEEVMLATLQHRSRETVVRLTPRPLVLFDYLARTRWFPQTGTQIANGMAADPFVVEHARFATGKYPKQKCSLSRFSVKTTVHRIRVELRNSFRDAALHFDPCTVLTSEQIGNQTLYRLRAEVQWLHIP